MSEVREVALAQGDAYRLRQRVHRAGGYHIRAIRRLPSSSYYELMVDDLQTGQLFTVHSEDDWDRGVRRLAVEIEDLPFLSGDDQ